MKFWDGSKLIAALTLFAASFAIAQTVSIELKNGDRVTGRVVIESTNAITLSNSSSHVDHSARGNFQTD